MSGRRGQAALELLASVPVLVAAVLVAWQLIALLAAAGRAGERARAAALTATGPSGGTVTATATQRVPSALPGMPALAAGARAVVRLP